MMKDRLVSVFFMSDVQLQELWYDRDGGNKYV